MGRGQLCSAELVLYGEVWSADVRCAGVSRLAWVLTYEDSGTEIVSREAFYVDYCTGERIGGCAA